ncbi:MAG: CsgG/HfaB family protein [Bdellovibrionota bacterium]
MFTFRKLISYCLILIVFSACSARESSHVVAPKYTRASQQGHKRSISVALGKVENRSQYMVGVFFSGNSKLTTQAKQMLTMHLAQSGCFDVRDRNNLDEGAAEAKYLGKKVKIAGAEYIITGAVTEFGRRELGSSSSIFAKSKRQIMYANFSISLVNALDSRVISSASGAGEVQLSTKEVLGFGSKAGYDTTLADKVLDLAIREAVDNLIIDLEGRGIL